jgi:hypothetical protein
VNQDEINKAVTKAMEALLQDTARVVDSLNVAIGLLSARVTKLEAFQNR